MSTRSKLVFLAVAVLLGCASDDTGSGGTTAGSSSGGGQGGAAAGCDDVNCTNPGEACVDGACMLDCRRPSALPCADGTVCDASDVGLGQCVAPDAPCLTTSEPETCGDKVCGPGAACDGAGRCYPRVPCGEVACDTEGCWGTLCACTRPAGCSPAPLGAPGEAGTLHDDAFRSGLVDVEFDPTCGAWGVTLISGPDHLRSMSPAGQVTAYPSITNLNMGEVSVLQQITVPEKGSWPAVLPGPPAPPEELEVAATYICCETCGCQLDTVPQGAIRLDTATGTLPLVIPSATFTTGMGPFGGSVIDTGPAGLSYGMNRVLYVGNIDTNGDYHRVDLATQEKQLVTTFAARVYASTPFDAVTMLVALEGGELRLLRTLDGSSSPWGLSDQPVTGLVRDFFDGTVYVARSDGSILRYAEDGASAPFQSAPGAARISIAPDGFLYALVVPPPFADHMPTLVRFELPDTR